MSLCPSRWRRCGALRREPRPVSDGVSRSALFPQGSRALTDQARSVTSPDRVPALPRCGKSLPAFLAHCGEPGAAARPVTASALVPPLPGFPQQFRSVPTTGRPVTSADRPSPHRPFAPDAGADDRAHRRVHPRGPPLDVPSPAGPAARAGNSCCTSFASSPPTPPARTSCDTRNTAVVPPCCASASSADARTTPAPVASSTDIHPQVDLFTAAKWFSVWPPPKVYQTSLFVVKGNFERASSTLLLGICKNSRRTNATCRSDE